MAIYDGFIFFNELDLLELRLRELESVVDRFIIVEAPVTFSGRPKPLYFKEHAEQFSRWSTQIVHIVVDDMPGGSDPWPREHHQRNAIARGLADARPDDGVMISDGDEIPAADAVRRWPGEARTFEQMFSYYWINCVGGGWCGTRIVKVGDLANRGGPSKVRLTDFATLPNAGWHVSYAGGPRRIAEKLQAFSHTDLDQERFKDPDHLRLVTSFGMDLFGRPGGWHFTPLDDRFPAAVRNDRKRFGHLVCDALFHEEWYSNEQLTSLAAAAARVRPLNGAVVEIGCWEGRSTIAIANTCYPDRVIAIDTWRGSTAEHPEHATVTAARERDVFRQFQANVRALTRGNVAAMRRDCHRALSSWIEPIKFAHVDGSHDYASVRASIAACRRHLIPGGIVCGADFLTADSSRTDLDGGVERAVRELLPGFALTNGFWSWQRPHEDLA